MKTISLLLATGLLIHAQSPSVVLNWPPGAGNPPATQYNVYRATLPAGTTCDAKTAGLTFAKINTAPISATTTTDTAVQRGSDYCYYATATLNGKESGPGGAAVAAVELNSPGPITITIPLAGVVTMPDGSQLAFNDVKLAIGK